MLNFYGRPIRKQVVGACCERCNAQNRYYDEAIGCARNRGCPGHSGSTQLGRCLGSDDLVTMNVSATSLWWCQLVSRLVCDLRFGSLGSSMVPVHVEMLKGP